MGWEIVCLFPHLATSLQIFVPSHRDVLERLARVWGEAPGLGYLGPVYVQFQGEIKHFRRHWYSTLL